MFVIPAVAAFAAAGGTIAGVGAALAGTAGFATFATVAGGFMASAGMLTKNKTLTKIGSVLGLAGAVTGLASSFASGAGEAASSAAGDAASSAASDAVTEAAKTGAGDVLSTEVTNSALGESLGKVGGDAASMAGGSQLPQNALGSFGQAAPDAGAALQLDPNSFGGTPNLMDQYRMTVGQGGLQIQDGMNVAGDVGASRVLIDAGQQFRDKTALENVLDKVRGAGKWLGDKANAAGAWMEKNQAATKLAGDVVRGGMQMYAQNDAMNEQMNLLAQRRARLNQPVVLGIQPPQLTNYRTGG